MYSQLQGVGMTGSRHPAGLPSESPARGLIISASRIFWIRQGSSSASCWGWCGFARPPFGAAGGGAVARWSSAAVAGWRHLARPASPGRHPAAPVVPNAITGVAFDKEAARLKSRHDGEKDSGAHHAEHPDKCTPYPTLSARSPLARQHPARAALALNRLTRRQPGRWPSRWTAPANSSFGIFC